MTCENNADLLDQLRTAVDGKRRGLWMTGAPVAQWVKRWPIDLADRVRSPLEATSSQP